jgi:hypothetical protein
MIGQYKETQAIAEKYWSSQQCGPCRLRWRSQFKHHDDEDDGDYAVTEGFHRLVVISP